MSAWLPVFLPDPALRPFIRQCWLIRGRNEQQGPIGLLPDGGVSLVLNLGDGIDSSRFGTRWCGAHALIVEAQTLSDSQMLIGESCLCGITFKQDGFTFFHPYHLLDRMADEAEAFEGRCSRMSTGC